MARNNSKITYLPPKIEHIASIENLFFAWKKLENEFSFYDVWYEEESFKTFKFNLKAELARLRNEMLSGEYRLQPIQLIPFPKSGLDKARQSFRIAVRDQVAWVAVCNILGPYAEAKMPAWSFGNRLFVPMWREYVNSKYEYDEVKYNWKNGKLLSSNGRVYQPWNRSWPRFRHLLTATMKKMAYLALDKDEAEYVDGSSKLEPWLKLNYLNDSYFKERQETNNGDGDNKEIKSAPSSSAKKQTRNIYWASIDISKFYPHIKCLDLCKMLIKHCKVKDERTQELLHKMLSFEMIQPEYEEEDMVRLGLKGDVWKSFQGLPTGLLVGGWLANIYLLDKDLEISEKLKDNRKVAHFRYVDDHTFLSYSPKELVHWVQKYKEMLGDIGLEVNDEKFQPNGICKIKPDDYSADEQDNKEYSFGKVFLEESWDEEYFNTEDKSVEIPDKWRKYDEIITEVEKNCKIDPKFPTPLMTQTLQKVSQLGGLDLDLLNDREIASVIHDLKTLIVTDFPEEEIKGDTRVSFASTMLSRMLRGHNFDYGLLSTFRRMWIDRRRVFIAELREQGKPENDIREFENKAPITAIFDLPKKPGKEPLYLPDGGDNELKRINGHIKNILYSSSETYSNTANSVFSLLKKAAEKVPDKVKIWIRLTQFCLAHLPEKLPEVFSLLQHVNKKTLNPLGFRFIQSQLYAFLSTILVRKSWDYYFSLSEKEKNEDARKCIEVIIALNLYEREFSFESSSLRLFGLASEFARSILNIKETGEISFNLDADEKTKLFVVSWLLDGVPKRNQKDFNIFLMFSDVMKSITETDTRLEYLLSFVISSNVNYSNEEGYEIARLLKIIDSQELESLMRLKKERFDIEQKDGFILLKSFISGDLDNNIDGKVRQNLEQAGKSELFMLKLCKEIVTCVNNREDDCRDYIDINNIYVKIDDLQKAWTIIGFNGEIEIVFSNNTLTTNNFILLDDNYDMFCLYKMGVVLYNMLSHNTDIYWLKVRPEYGYEWPSLIRQLAETGKIGSFSERLLLGCLLPTARELTRMNVTTTNVKDISSYFASCYIPHIGFLSEMIEEYLVSMTHARVPITNETVRELKIIDLD